MADFFQIDNHELKRLSKALRRVDGKEFSKPIKDMNRLWVNNTIKNVKQTGGFSKRLGRARSYGRQVSVSQGRVYARADKIPYASFPHFGAGGRQRAHLFLYRAGEQAKSNQFFNEYAQKIRDAMAALFQKGVKRF